MTATDTELLGKFVREHSEDAFAALVKRHLDLVYSAALRQVRSPELAQEVSQSVFTDLARNASRLRSGTILTAWLYQVARRTAIDVVRRESRRQLRERLAVEAASMNARTDWNHIEPLLEEAMDALDETDRAALLLRYFENKSLRDVGLALGVNEDAAQKRVSRAVDRLRECFTRRGVAIASSAVGLAISANAVQAAPAGLAPAISGALVGAAGHSSAGLLATKTLTMTTIQKTVVASVLAVAVGTGIYKARQGALDREQVLQQQLAPLAERLRQIESERDAAVSNLAGAREELGRLRQDLADLPKLRGEVARLRDDSQELSRLKTADSSDAVKTAALSWTERVSRLKQRLAETPAARIPELAMVTEEDWLNAAKGHLESEADFRRALSALRGAGENKFIQLLQPALKAYLKANNNQFPADVSQLQAYFKSPVDPGILDRWEVMSADKMKNLGLGGDMLISQKAPVDEVFDSCFGVGPSGYGSSGSYLSRQVAATLEPVYKAFQASHGEEYPSDPSELLAYATTPSQQAAIQKLILKKSSGENH